MSCLKISRKIKAFLLIGLILLVGLLVFALSSSDNYRMTSEVLNSAGGTSTSSSYRMTDAIGQATSGGKSKGTRHGIEAGFIYTTMEVLLSPEALVSQVRYIADYYNLFRFQRNQLINPLSQAVLYAKQGKYKEAIAFLRQFIQAVKSLSQGRRPVLEEEVANALIAAAESLIEQLSQNLAPKWR